jgi:hypothetical protein
MSVEFNRETTQNTNKSSNKSDMSPKSIGREETNDTDSKGQKQKKKNTPKKPFVKEPIQEMKS